MTENELTRDFLQNFLRHNQKPSRDPVVQILAVKKLDGPGGSPRLRLDVSDDCMATTSLELNAVNLPVIRVSRYALNEMRGGQKPDGTNRAPMKIIMFTLFEVIDEPGRKLGEPVVLKLDQPPLLDQNARTGPPPAQVQRPAPSGARMAAGSVGYGNQPHAASEIQAHPIVSLTPYQNKWRIRARVTRKGEIKTWSNPKGEGKLFDMDLADESGEIRATAFKAECDKFFGMLQPEQLYYISGGQIKQANKRFSSLKNDYELTLSAQTVIEPCYERDVKIPTKVYSVTKFDKLEKDKVVDIMAIVKTIGEVQPINKRDGTTTTKRELTLVDDTKKSVSLTLWAERAENMMDMIGQGNENPVIAVKGCKVGEFNGGLQLSTMPSCQIEFDPDLPTAIEMRRWFDNEGYLQETEALSAQRTGTGGSAQIKLIGVAQTLHLGESEQKGAYFNVRAQVQTVNKQENTLYKACPKDGCNKKVIDSGSGQYRCEKCDNNYDNYKYRALLTIQIGDFTGSQFVTLFSEAAEQLLGMKIDELGNMLDQQDPDYETVFTRPLFQRFIFRIKAQQQFYNDEARMKWTVLDVKKYTGEDDVKLLNDTISKLEVAP